MEENIPEEKISEPSTERSQSVVKEVPETGESQGTGDSGELPVAEESPAAKTGEPKKTEDSEELPVTEESPITTETRESQNTEDTEEVSQTTDKKEATTDTSSSVKDGGYKAVLIGATGATGRYLFAELVNDKRFSSIITIGRRAATISEDYEHAAELNLDEEVKSGRVEQVTDKEIFKEITKEKFGKYLEGCHVFFSCFGTSRKQAGSAAEFRRIDFGYNMDFMTVAKESNVSLYSLMSSQGANSKSWFLYLQCKGELDDKAGEMFENASIWRPGFLDRGTSGRVLEKVAAVVMHKTKTATIGKAMLLDAVQRLGSNDEEMKGRKIYSTADIYKMCGLDTKGRLKSN